MLTVRFSVIVIPALVLRQVLLVDVGIENHQIDDSFRPLKMQQRVEQRTQNRLALLAAKHDLEKYVVEKARLLHGLL